ncbi:hypothetical protein BYT27DRAFT_7178293 [Phlegmacium glaucopus]|nr:hypothetical protein BYT27DRAFT_7178293 [Phlegmacium glaucopus]
MSRFLLGDQLGNIKVLRYFPQENRIDVKGVYHQEIAPASSVERLAINSSSSNDQTTLAAAFSNGSLLLSALKEDDTFEVLAKWSEPRLAENKFIGLSLDDSAIFSCTSNGILQKASCNTGSDGSLQTVHSTSLPSRLCDWRMSDNRETFAYGGDEVDLSVWDTELAWQCQPQSSTLPGSSKKRKRNDDLFPAEIWRARNVPNDSLGLRQPVRITSLTYLSPSSSSHHILTGTQFGDLRRYDTRAARRPVSNWKGVGKVGGVRLVEKGFSENELFVSDNGSNLFSIDLRTGGILYSYKGMSGAVTSISPSSTIHMVSTSLDRYFRIHTVVPPPSQSGSHLERRGGILEKTYLTCVPTTVVWDQQTTSKTTMNDNTTYDDDLWDKMEHVG